MSNKNLRERTGNGKTREGGGGWKMLMLPLPSLSLVLISLSLPHLISCSRDKPKRGRCNYKKEGNDQRYAGKTAKGWVQAYNLTRHCHLTGITSAMIDIFRDSPSNSIIFLAHFHVTAWNYLRSDTPYRFSTPVLSGLYADKIVNQV